MASDNENVVIRTAARALRALGISSSSSIADAGRVSPADSVNYGMWSLDELRHFDGIDPAKLGVKKDRPSRVPKMSDIGTYLEQVSNDTHTKAEELTQLTTVTPELKVAKRVYVATMMSPTDLQTNTVNITMNYAGVSTEVRTEILEKLNTFFNSEHHLAQKMARWLRNAGFETGSQSILILPKHEMDVQNVIADTIAAEDLAARAEINATKKRIEASTESLSGMISLEDKKTSSGVTLTDQIGAYLDEEISCALESLNAEKFFAEHKDGFKTEDKDGKVIEKVASVEELTEKIKKGTLKLLRGDGNAVQITRDVSQIKKGATKNSEVLSQLLKDAQAQFAGFDPKNPYAATASDVPTYTISDTPKVGKGDLPIVLELPADAVIPVCAPRDNQNHIGYFVLIDENGQPITGKNTYFNTNSTNVTNRLAMQAARGIYGNATLTSFSELTNNPQVMLQQMADVFAVAVNKLLESKLNKEGLTGLDVNLHNAVGKAMFLNLLSKNKIRMVFVPEPMMVYYRFDHRENGTGKTLIEDASEMLALRTTLVVAKLMAEVDNATLHRTIEVDIDEKDTNPIQTMQTVLREALSKYAPSFSTEVQTAAESIINRNISVKPKNMAGLANDLNVTIEKTQGSLNGPNSDLLDKLNNWVGLLMGGLPASLLNQLGENEFSRSVATTNMYFANNIAECQTQIKPHNKKYVVNYVSCSDHLLNIIREALGTEKKGEDPKLKENQSRDVKDEKVEKQVREIVASLEVDLPPPQMAAKKAHFEELTAFADAIEKIIEKVFADDIVIDDNLKGSMGMIRAIITSKVLREFLPKLGCQAIADIPEPSSLDADYAKACAMYLLNVKRKIKNITDMASGQLPPKQTDGLDENLNPEEEENPEEPTM